MTAISLADLKQRLREFAAERDWEQFEVQEAFYALWVQMSWEHRDVRNDHSPKIIKKGGIDTHAA